MYQKGILVGLLWRSPVTLYEFNICIAFQLKMNELLPGGIYIVHTQVFRTCSTPPHLLPEYITCTILVRWPLQTIKILHSIGMDWAVHQFKKAKAEDNEPWWTKSVSQGCLKPKIMTVPSPRLKNEEAKSEKRFINPSFSTSCLKGAKKNGLVSQCFQHFGVLIVWKQEKYFTNE